MTAKIIVCVTSHQALATVFQHGKSSLCQSFQVDEAGRRAFGELLKAHPEVPVYLMVDSVEEDYHTEVLPHVVGHVRQELLQRKLKQAYRGMSYCAAWPQGRESDKRRDDRYLFAALTNTDPLQPWLDVLRALGAPLAGVYLLPMVTQVVVERLRLAETDLLLVSKHSDGLRQSFFQGGQLKASRLAVVDVMDGCDVAQLAVEVGKTRLYLTSLRLMTRESRLTVLLLDTDDSMGALQQRLQIDPGLVCHRLTAGELSSRLGTELNNCPYALHMVALALHPPACNLAPASVTRSFSYFRRQHLLYVGSAVVLAAGVAWAGANLLQKYWLGNEIGVLEAQTRDQQARYVEVTKTFPQTPASADNLEKAVKLAARIRQDGRTPERMMLVVSHALAAEPEVVLTRLDWKLGADGQDAGKNAEMGQPLTAGVGLTEAGSLEGEIRPFHGDYRAAMASINRLAESLRHAPEVAGVSVAQMPLNVHSASTLSGNTMDTSSPEAMRAEFKLRLVLKGRP